MTPDLLLILAEALKALSFLKETLVQLKQEDLDRYKALVEAFNKVMADWQAGQQTQGDSNEAH